VDIVLCDTRVEHSLASSEYNIRRSECDKGVKTIQSVFPDVKSLRDADPAMLDKVKTRMKTTIYDRCHYIIHENIRVEKACKALLKNDFSTFGKLMYETHAGLSKEYMVSCIELDTLVDIAKKSPDISGARMMGGGFGGCTINLVKKGKAEKFISLVNEEYKKTIGSTIQIYRVKTSDGAGKLN
jgi:galactokinase